MSLDADLMSGRRPPPPLRGAAQERMLLARPLVTLAQLTVPVLQVTQGTLNVPPGRLHGWSAVPGPILLLI